MNMLNFWFRCGGFALCHDGNWQTFNWLVYNKDGNFICCKIRTKAKKSDGMCKESRSRYFQNTTLFRHVGLEEHQMLNLCPHATCPLGYGTHVYGSGPHSLGLRPSLLAM